MDTRTGQIYTTNQVEAMLDEDRRYMQPVKTELTRLQRRSGKIGRNDPCGCGSGQKFKRCCMLRRFAPGA